MKGDLVYVVLAFALVIIVGVIYTANIAPSYSPRSYSSSKVVLPCLEGQVCSNAFDENKYCLNFCISEGFKTGEVVCRNDVNSNVNCDSKGDYCCLSANPCTCTNSLN